MLEEDFLMTRDQRLANMLWRLTWHSREARHEEEYYIPCNIWREADIFPPALREALGGFQPGARGRLTFPAGQLLPGYDQEKIYTHSLKTFRGGDGTPQVGRFYPRGFLPGFFGNTLPCRCTEVNPPNFVVDLNHPLAGVPLELGFTIVDVESKRSEKGGECKDWLDQITTGPGMQARWRGRPTDFFAAGAFARPDEREDAVFYEKARLVSHVDSRARETVASLYGRLLKRDMAVLDLLSSWQSHLPDDLALYSMVGLGLNEEELQRNTRLNGYVLQDINREPHLPFGDGVFDAVICNLSVEYLIKPFEVFQEIARVLKPGGLHVQTFSHRWFPPKVINIWAELTEFERQGLVVEYFLRTGAFTNIGTYSSRGWHRPSTDRYSRQFPFSDPVFAVWGENKG
jgi:FKBP-type peptidyl-prolyl cis-trans isomerase 2/SAM-dependent methyltransferase